MRDKKPVSSTLQQSPVAPADVLCLDLKPFKLFLSLTSSARNSYSTQFLYLLYLVQGWLFLWLAPNYDLISIISLFRIYLYLISNDSGEGTRRYMITITVALVTIT
jgi:hypothetical protein